ncbi:hypothetical protein ABTF13_16165 [Acinetobacter baumannii]
MSIQFEEIFQIMVNSAQKSFKQHWPTIKDYATGEFDKLATTIVNIEFLLKTGQISAGEASILLEMQKNTARAVMLALKGMTLLMVEQAINDALDAVKNIVNNSLGFAFL